MEQLLAHLFGDYLLQSDWMAQNKTKASLPALVHALTYSLCFVPLCWHADIQNWFFWVPSGHFYVELWPNGKPYFHWLALSVIVSTHFVIDRFRLARYVVWAKNWLGPRKKWYYFYGHTVGDRAFFADHDGSYGDNWTGVPERTVNQPTPPLWSCPTGYASTAPIWLATWLLIIADNTLHLAINYAALRWL